MMPLALSDVGRKLFFSRRCVFVDNQGAETVGDSIVLMIVEDLEANFESMEGILRVITGFSKLILLRLSCLVKFVNSSVVVDSVTHLLLCFLHVSMTMHLCSVYLVFLLCSILYYHLFAFCSPLNNPDLWNDRETYNVRRPVT